ncbi:thiolase family protein [Allorhodopirellula heiligendammensis]|uniref:Acetyl-CoA acyltransferase n=1 Tax=Allorhodopirellula heiligendammensis TaxID=2714739 RepID=A0A5C6BCV5_9BACT|nr:thiolase family protein [Allorhodopirellula heiligendammensis]TWU09878.1 putative acetyl-CoA acyltransferase [Allorhodopirellula heiligendammensis]
MTMSKTTMAFTPVAIIDGIRTPFAKAFGRLANVSAVELGRLTVEQSLLRCGLAPEAIDQVIFGNVSSPPDAANIARVIALKAGVPQSRIAHTVNRNCASGMQSLVAGCNAIHYEGASAVVAGGTESMSQIPLLVSPDAARVWTRLSRAKTVMARLKVLKDFRPRHFQPIAGIELGLTDPVSGMNMGETAELLATEYNVSREEQDTFAAASHIKAAQTQERCFFSGEITTVSLPDGGRCDQDDGIRSGQTADKLAKLRPIFARDGTVTAGNSCQITDGAAALVLSSESGLERFARPPLGRLTAYAIAGCDPRRMGLGPVYAVAKLFRQTGLSFADFDLIEINEAFAAQVIACERAMASKSFAQQELGQDCAVGELPMDRVNVHGGAIALGHPVGTTGTRMVLTLLRALHDQGKHRGLATLCVGGGQGMAIVVETP